MVVSAVVPIPRIVIERLALDLAAGEHSLGVEHCFAWGDAEQIGVLTFLWSSQGKETLFFSRFRVDGSLERQFDLPRISAVLFNQDRVYPMAIALLTTSRMLIGASTIVADTFMSALYLVDIEQDVIIDRLPWGAARIAWTHDNYLLGTFHANLEGRQRTRLDDAIVISTEPSKERMADRLGPMQLVAILDVNSPREFPTAYQQFDLSRPRRPLLRSTGLCGSFRTHVVVPMNDGNFLLPVWETAQQQVLNYYFAIYSRAGDPIHVIESAIDRFSQIANDPVHGVLVYHGDTEMAVYDYAGRRQRAIAIDKATASALKNYELISISGRGKLLFASTKRKQTNCFFLFDASKDGMYDDYENVVRNGVKAHKTWLAKLTKDRNPIFFRWK